MATDPKPAGCCASGTLHTETPAGSASTLHDFPCYTTLPAQNLPPKATIVIIPDAFGWELPNTRVLADHYAQRLQCRVLIPDIMDGHHLDWALLDSLNTMTDKEVGVLQKIVPTLKVAQSFPYFLYRCRFSLVQPRLTAFLTSLHAEQTPSPLPIGAAGFCWGGKFVFALCDGNTYTTPLSASENTNEDKKESKPLITSGFTAHPSNLALPTDAENATLPLAVCAGGEDFVFGAAEAEKVRGVFEKKKEEGRGEQFEIRVVEGARHGFAVRGDLGDEKEAGYCAQAEDWAVQWFERWLLGEGKGGL